MPPRYCIWWLTSQSRWSPDRCGEQNSCCSADGVAGFGEVSFFGHSNLVGNPIEIVYPKRPKRSLCDVILRVSDVSDVSDVYICRF